MPVERTVNVRGSAMARGATNIASIWRLATLLVMSDFVEVIFVQLADKRGEVGMLEVFREDGLGELLILLCLGVRGRASPAELDNVPPRLRSYRHLHSIAPQSCTMGPRAFCKVFDQHLSTYVPQQHCLLVELADLRDKISKTSSGRWHVGLTKSLELFPACAAGSLSGGMMTTGVEVDGGLFDING